MSEPCPREDIVADHEYQEGLASIPGSNLLANLNEKEIIKWNYKNPVNSSVELYRCFKTGTDVRVEVDKKNWKTEVPELCALLGMRHAATKEEVLSALENSDAFQPNSVFKSEYEAGKKVQYDMSPPKDGEFKLQISIPTKFHEKFANQASEEFIKLEQFTKQELARVFQIPEDLLNPEISVLEVKPGSLLICVGLVAPALMLIFIGWQIGQTPEWQEHKFKILMLAGGLTLGMTIGTFVGPIGAGVGAIVGGVFGLGMASFITSPTDKAAAKANALLRFSGGIIALFVEFGPSVNKINTVLSKTVGEVQK